MSRPPFHIVGILPFVLGTLFAWETSGTLNWPVFILGLAAVVLIMLATYYNGEYYDIEEDRIAAKSGSSAFSGGSRVIVSGALPRRYAITGAYISLALAVAAGLVLQFYYRTGIWTIPLGVIGLFFGFFYSKPPFRWVERGIGEILIGFSYGWLPVAVAFYMQTQRFDPFLVWMSIPIGLTIFNVILLNEFPDYEADRKAGKKNLVVRLGKQRGILIYISAQILTWIMFPVSMSIRFMMVSSIVAVPFLIVSLILVIMALMKKYMVPQSLTFMCGLGILLNTGISLIYVFGVVYG
ncbi:MAG: prenyltransferase [Actinobacteria bacterium]|nr:prenyltransferase [Actinomycetota bacterium]